ncbi:MAG: SpoIIE family protein phosphatase [Bacteroidales bacterium]|jgi:sigma-B regulation protein RsbU (phosphoserine phosphatase)|nr:SpoIIE family protein phosphatase [Bacteroidales bacterium]
MDRLKLSKFKLDALLDITLSINANLPVEELLAKYGGILRNCLNIGKVLVFKRSGAWECIFNNGFPESTAAIDVETELCSITEISFTPCGTAGDADIIIPVFNNNTPLAYILIGDFEEEGKGMSPVLKHLNYIQTISSIIIVAIENIRLFDESLRQEALRKEMELAAMIQKMLIPDNSAMPRNPKLVVNGFYFPYYATGGDYYDCIKLSETKTGFCIADVSGKGIAAAILMSNFQASLRALFTLHIKLGTLVEKLNSIVNGSVAGEKFITLFAARYDHETGILEYINAAHDPPVLYDTVTGSIRHLHATCVGIGMLDEIPRITECKLTIENHSKIVCYTDGISELKDNNGKNIGTAAIEKYIMNTAPVADNIREMINELRLADNAFDDASLIAADIIR